MARSAQGPHRAWFGRIALLGIVSILILLGCEAAVRVLESTGVLSRNDRFDEGSHSGANRFSLHPELMWELDPDNEFINSQGFRGREYSPEKPRDTFRIIVLGDSVTFGQGVPKEDGFTTLLESTLSSRTRSQVEVLNFGVGGYNTRQEVESYRLRWRQWQPDLILLTYVLNDPQTPEATMRGAAHIEEQREQRTEVKLDTDTAAEPSQHVAHEAMRLWEQSRLLHLIRDRVEAIRDPEARTIPRIYIRLHQPRSKSWRGVASAFADLEEMMKQDRIPVVIVITPVLLRLQSYPYGPIHDLVAREARRRGFHVIDLLPALAGASTESLKFNPKDNIHPNAKAHRLISDALASGLHALDLTPRQ